MELTEKHAELVGLHLGDGSFTRRKDRDVLRFQLRGDATTDRQHYESFVIPLCNELIGYPIFGRELSTVFDRKGNCFGISIQSNLLGEFFENLDIKAGRKENIQIPNWVKENEDFSKAFIRGLFDTDGCIYYETNHTAKSNLHIVGMVIISCTSRSIIYDSFRILSKLGLKPLFRERKKFNGEKTVYVTKVKRPHVKKFMSLIGSHNPKHLSKFQIAQKFGFCPPHTTPKQREQILKGCLNPILLYSRG